MKQVVDGWLRGVAHLPTPNVDDRPPGERVELVVIHNISLPPGKYGLRNVHALFTNRLDPCAHPFFAEVAGARVSAHLLIERDGTITQFASFDRRAWHAGASEFDGRPRCNDFSVGIEVDFKANPAMWTPSASVTLPVWRDKIAAGIADAQAETRAATARLSQEEVELAAELAALLYLYRESTRDMELLEARLLPKGRQALEAARAGYANDKSRFSDVIDSYRQLLDFELAFLAARSRKELALASLSLLIAGTPPPGSPLPNPAERANPVPSKEVSP